MKSNRHSSTAEATAAVRAWHRLNHEPLILDDPHALDMTSSAWRVICKNALLTWLVFERVLKVLQPVAAEIISRSRYTEDKLEESLRNGIRQYVLLGAGFDTFALRRPDLLRMLQMYEVDHPLSQSVKMERLRKLAPVLPDNLEFVPVDFENETLADALTQSGYHNEQPAFFSWLGVVQYLAPESVFGTLESLSQVAAPGSEVVFDYLIPRDRIGQRDAPVMTRLERFTARRGEPLSSTFTPEEMESELRQRGFEILENLSPAEQQQRYFTGRSDSLRPFDGWYLMHARRAA
jgi:methyltransferase (TIGR00027 family)